MSDIAIQSSTYEELRLLADQLDRLLVDLRAGHATPSDSRRKSIAEFLLKVARATPTDLPALRLAALLGYADQQKRKEWIGLAKSLEQPTVSAKALEQLEQLAEQLESRRAETVTKMRGVDR